MLFLLSDKKYIYWDWVCTYIHVYKNVPEGYVGKISYFVFMKGNIPKCQEIYIFIIYHCLSIDLKENNYFYSKCQNNIF